MRFAIHIENLRLEGVEGLTGEELALQIERELQRMVEVWGVPPALREGGAVEFGGQAVHLPAGVAREAVGAEVARQLAGSWFGSV
jgi:hypothetical protein